MKVSVPLPAYLTLPRQFLFRFLPFASEACHPLYSLPPWFSKVKAMTSMHHHGRFSFQRRHLCSTGHPVPFFVNDVGVPCQTYCVTHAAAVKGTFLCSLRSGIACSSVSMANVLHVKLKS